MLRGRLLAGMAAAVGGGGLGQLYAGYVPFLVRTLPYDVAELATYSQLTALRPRARAGPIADMAIGAVPARTVRSAPPCCRHDLAQQLGVVLAPRRSALCGLRRAGAVVLACMPLCCMSGDHTP